MYKIARTRRRVWGSSYTCHCDECVDPHARHMLTTLVVFMFWEFGDACEEPYTRHMWRAWGKPCPTYSKFRRLQSQFRHLIYFSERTLINIGRVFVKSWQFVWQIDLISHSYAAAVHTERIMQYSKAHKKRVSLCNSSHVWHTRLLVQTILEISRVLELVGIRTEYTILFRLKYTLATD